MPFNYNIETAEDVVVLDLNGRLMDKMEAVEVGAALDQHIARGDKKFVVDLTDLEYMNSTGLNILLNLVNKARNGGGEAVMCGAAPRISSLFSVTKLDTIFKQCANREEARKVLQKGGN